MGCLIGETVTYIRKTRTGTDGFGQPIYADVAENVENVLIAPVAGNTEIVDATELNGIVSMYTLAIPKHDFHDWTRCKVQFWGETWQSVGKPTRGMDAMIPLEWNQKVIVRRCE